MLQGRLAAYIKLDITANRPSKPRTTSGHLIKIRAGHVIAAGRVGTEELALSLDQGGAAVGTHALGTRGFFASGSQQASGMRLSGRGFGGCAHRPGVVTSVAPSGAGVPVGSGPVFSTRPAGVRRASTGVVSGVGTTAAAAACPCAGPPPP